ncbi:MAG TPA: histidine kinase, partial [Cyanobacteria bacterium UBA11153]|nr:histidine kinase [Cyanobacteria bacterium UBA11153]
MIIQTSVLSSLVEAIPHLRQQIYFKSSLTALSHAMEDRVLATSDPPLIIACFQRERFYRQEAHRYRRLAEITSQLYVLAAPETDFNNSNDSHEMIAFDSEDALSQEWHLVIVAKEYANCLICREKTTLVSDPAYADMDHARRFEGIWSFDRQVTIKAAELLLNRIEIYRPDLATKIAQGKTQYLINQKSKTKGKKQGIDKSEEGTKEEILNQNFQHKTQGNANENPFVERLVTYLQAGQYKLLKAYRSIYTQQQRERLVNLITSAIRNSLNSHEILEIAVEELGKALGCCRCLIYRCQTTDVSAIINHEYLGIEGREEINLTSTMGQEWPLQDNCLFQAIAQHHQSILIEDTAQDPRIYTIKELTENQSKGKKPNSPSSTLKNLVQTFAMRSWLIVPVLYQGQLLGMVELHHCLATPYRWKDEELALVEAIATQVGVALIQAAAYTNLQNLNQQLEILDRTRSNLVAIAGHELRTPLSTIRVCLESLAQEPDMPGELRQVMLETALADSERMRKLVQDFLTLSRLESDRVEWHPEPLILSECVELALSQIRAHYSQKLYPHITS